MGRTERKAVTASIVQNRRRSADLSCYLGELDEFSTPLLTATWRFLTTQSHV